MTTAIATRITTAADLGSLVRTIRKSRGLSQQEFADVAGVGRRYLSELEQGKERASLGPALRVLAAAGIDLTARTR